MDPVSAIAQLAGTGVLGSLGIWALWNWRRDQVHQREKNEQRQQAEWARAEEERKRQESRLLALEEVLRTELTDIVRKSITVIAANTEQMQRQEKLIGICEERSGAFNNGIG